jgi:ABC-2 type transport system ATP-binding protein
MAVIEVRHLTKRFGPVLAVDQLSFELQSGTATGFLGPNGAGKTTTLRMILGLVRPTDGTAVINGRSYHELENPFREVGAVLEASSAHPARTARDHLQIQAINAGLPASRVDHVLAQVELKGAADRKVRGFSLGMRQRLGLATALIGDPQILILDEPTNGLDPEGVRWLRNLLRSLVDEGRTVLVSSHILAEVAQTVDMVVIIDRGRLVTQSTLQEMTAGANEPVRVRTPEPDTLQRALAGAGISATITAPNQVAVAEATAEQIGRIAAERQIPIFGMTSEVASLEDVFLRLTSDGKRQELPQ